MAGKAVLFVCLLAFATSAYAQFPIPPRYDGFALTGKKSTRPLVLEAFVDLLCPSCRNGWPVLKAITKTYSEENLQLIVHPFPVPFHHNANFAARGMHIAASINSSLAYPWMELVYNYQGNFADYHTRRNTPEEVIDQFAELATKLGVEKSEFLAGYGNLQTDIATRISFKYGCHRAVVGTPTYLVNGVTVQGADDSWSLEDWRNLLDPLLQDSAEVK